MNERFLFCEGDEVKIKSTGEHLVVVDRYDITTSDGKRIPVYHLAHDEDDDRREWLGMVYGNGELEAVE